LKKFHDTVEVRLDNRSLANLKEPLNPSDRRLKQGQLQLAEREKLLKLLSPSQQRRIADEGLRYELWQRIQNFLTENQQEFTLEQKSKCLSIIGKHIEPEGLRSLMTLAYQLAQWAQSSGKIPLPVKNPDPKLLEKTAGHVLKLIQHPLFNPALTDGDFDTWQFWKLPDQLEALARLIRDAAKERAGLSRADYYRNILLAMFKGKYVRLLGRFSPSKAREILGLFGWQISIDNLSKCLLRARKTLPQ
jgi:hypothetical protein